MDTWKDVLFFGVKKKNASLIHTALVYLRDQGGVLLHNAAYHGHLEVAECLLEAGTDVNAMAVDGRTPLHNAACYGHLDMAKLLIEAGAEVNARDKDGWTPFDWAKMRRHQQIALLLRERGAVS